MFNEKGRENEPKWISRSSFIPSPAGSRQLTHQQNITLKKVVSLITILMHNTEYVTLA